ncbi:hypothetical protein Clocl_3748 [Acetivibrio clariflavus DSM 19732]|uniref:Uncharacterized protein n=1 Tax=Acetivibrio clariflavus (strain DSM 19732 / NBRC 101661 / EBR45) TaxID=720554 RepID=G8M0V9_ACECE|nr:hypothetical protein Clocl_3748 [Acetivibrio clariflavus DSM 19732]
MYLFPRNTSNHFKPRLFRLHNPSRRKPPRKAVDVFPQIITHIKIQGFPASPPPKSTFSADGKSPESPVFRPFFRRLFVFYICHQCHALNMAGPGEHVNRLNLQNLISPLGQKRHISRKSCRITGHIHNSFG